MRYTPVLTGVKRNRTVCGKRRPANSPLTQTWRMEPKSPRFAVRIGKGETMQPCKLAK
ncbi:hypothetical protein LINPERPRIM_LOCUS36938 [Linum perenne]